jgi:putative CocE/NonD family hydrolase
MESQAFMTRLCAAVAVLMIVASGSAVEAQIPDLAGKGSDVRPEVAAPTDGFNYTRQEVMIPMRDGVNLFTVIMIPKGVEGDMPIVLTRTPYDADSRTRRITSPDMAMMLPVADEPLVRGGYIRVYQDCRGKYKSEGDYVTTLPVRGPLNSGETDHVTDAWDTIDWLVRNVPGNNGRVGITGVSYDGYLTLMALLDPHPALKAAVPVNAMVDGWIGDDWYHNGAFRPVMMQYIYIQTTSMDSSKRVPWGYYDIYSALLDAGSVDEFGKRYGADQLPSWNRLIDNPTYNSFWQLQAVDKLLLEAPLSVPTLTVHSLYDQEDIYGPIASYLAREKKDSGNNLNFLAIGPWHHGQSWGDGSTLGKIKWGSDTSLWFREQVLQAFWDEHLKNKKPDKPLPPVLAFETGTNVWKSYESWPPKGVGESARLYLQAGGELSFSEPGALSGESAYDQYVSDPAKPIPYRVRPILPSFFHPDSTWRYWLADDQRHAVDRTDVLTYVSDVLTEPLTISGAVTATLFASTTGSDADWIVKLIDVYPNEVPSDPEMGGYQLMISADIMRGRYRESIETAKPIPAGEVLPFRVRMPHANHTFRTGHRIMVQVQSSWFPVYDRNPQTFVPNIAWARPEDYVKATQRVYHMREAASFIEIPTWSGKARLGN